MTAHRRGMALAVAGCLALGLALAVSQEPTQKAAVHGDPARLKRIEAAKGKWKIDKPVEFFTPQADAICSGLEVFPPDNPWNLVIEDWPLHPNSKNIVASIGASKPLRYNDDMGFILVSPDQKRVDVKIVSYPGESDRGPFPVPDNVPIEGWPSNYQRRKGERRSPWTTCSATS